MPMETTDRVRGHSATHCHMCKHRELLPVLDLGFHPHSDAFLRKEQLNEFEATYPLRLVHCPQCGLLQIDYFVDPRILYQEEYLYQSSTTETGRKHYTDMARSIRDRFAIPNSALAVDIGSNVGVLLGGFKDAGLKVLGVDPAQKIAEIANKNGIETIVDFFSAAVAKDIRERYGAASVTTGTNVFAHLHELDDAVNGMKLLLHENGIIVIEAPHALPLIENLEYDTIYHQHIAYLSVRPMRDYFARMGLELFDVEENAMHGGTLRYFVGNKNVHTITPSVQTHIDAEESLGLYSTERLARFAADVREQKRALVELLMQLKREGKRIVALSAPAKGNTLLNYCHLDDLYLDYATEKNPLKIGRYTPGMHLPIYSDDKLQTDKPDVILILAWNFADEIIPKLSDFRSSGGQCIIPVPKPRIV